MTAIHADRQPHRLQVLWWLIHSLAMLKLTLVHARITLWDNHRTAAGSTGARRAPSSGLNDSFSTFWEIRVGAPGGEGNMVTRLNRKGIDGRAPPGVEPLAQLDSASGSLLDPDIERCGSCVATWRISVTQRFFFLDFYIILNVFLDVVWVFVFWLSLRLSNL